MAHKQDAIVSDPLTAPRKKRIAVLTSGGDAPGMNAAVRAVVGQAIYRDCEPYIIRQGYQGLVAGGKENIYPANWNKVSRYLSKRGSKIESARCQAFREIDGRRIAVRNLILNGIDALVIIGGDGSLTGADKLRSEWSIHVKSLVELGQEDGGLTSEQVAPFKHLAIVGMVGSIDNDLTGTDITIGAVSALEAACTAVHNARGTARSHGRAMVVELMGRNCGWLSLKASLATGADYMLIPENPPEGDWKEDMLKVVNNHRARGRPHVIVVVSEGAKDREGNHISADEVARVLTNGGIETRVVVSGQQQRGCEVKAFDRILATKQGAEAIDAVLESTAGMETCFIGIDGNQTVRRSLEEAVQKTKSIETAIKQRNYDGAMKLRDAEFKEDYEDYMMISTMGLNDKAAGRPLRIAFITVGAPAGGMAQAIRPGVAFCNSHGHSPLAIRNGFRGLAQGEVYALNWNEVDKWTDKAASPLGTNRLLPSDQAHGGIAQVTKQMAYHKIDALLLIGGFEAFNSLSKLERARPEFPELKIPMVLLPATISNNVPGTQYSLGTDTCLNELVRVADSHKKSAKSAASRVAVVETQGSKCGYMAALAGLATGASLVYTPEETIFEDRVERDIERLKQAEVNQAALGQLVLVTDKAKHEVGLPGFRRLLAQELTEYINKHGRGNLEARLAIPGNSLQGDCPSAMDRTRAVKLALRSLERLEQAANDGTEFAAVIGIGGNGQARFTDISDLRDEDVTDWDNRRPRRVHWETEKRIGEIMGGISQSEPTQRVLRESRM